MATTKNDAKREQTLSQLNKALVDSETRAPETGKNGKVAQWLHQVLAEFPAPVADSSDIECGLATPSLHSQKTESEPEPNLGSGVLDLSRKQYLDPGDYFNSFQKKWRKGKDAYLSKWTQNQRHEDTNIFDLDHIPLWVISQASLSSSASSEIASPEPWIGRLHAFHEECSGMGMAGQDMRHFTKLKYERRLSLLCEAHILQGAGHHMYLLRFTGGEISKADGVGFVFTGKLPCPKKIQNITSIFVNQRGQICLRVRSELVKFAVSLKPLDLGDVIGLSINLQKQQACFLAWPAAGGPAATAEFSYGEALRALNADKALNCVSTGCFACIVKNVGVRVDMLS